jgi:hypothetical protein
MSSLFEGIRAKCQRERWFGPYFFSPKRRTQVQDDDPNRVGFMLPPAGDEQVQATEARLGVSLPPLLKTLYSEIANGGFGPGGGFYGIAGGYGSVESGTSADDRQTLINRYEGRSHKRLVDLSEYTQQEQNHEKPINLLIPYGEWWRELLPICDLGCVQEVGVDNQECVFVVAPIDSNEVYWLSQLPWTLEEWLWRWVRNEGLIEQYAPGAA